MGNNYQWEETFNERMLKVREALKRNVKKSLSATNEELNAMASYDPINPTPESQQAMLNYAMQSTPVGFFAGRLGKFAKEARTPESMMILKDALKKQYLETVIKNKIPRSHFENAYNSNSSKIGVVDKTKYRDWETDRKSTRLNSSHRSLSRMPSSA